MHATAVVATTPRPRRMASMAVRGAGRVALLAAILLLAATYMPTLLFGYHRYVLVGHSMEPHIHRGSLVFDEVVPVRRLRRGDVVTYIPAGHTSPLSHRIVFERRIAGRLVFQTKGDNNAAVDPGRFTFDQPVQARVKFALPYAGWIYIWLGDPSLRLWFAVIPAVFLAIWAAGNVWRQGGEILREQARAEIP